MSGILDKNQLTFVKKYEIFEPLFQKMDAIFDDYYWDCHKKY